MRESGLRGDPIDEAVESLKSLKPDRIILFGSRASGSTKPDSDIDLFLVKDGLNAQEMREYLYEAKRRLRKLTFKYRISFDIFGDASERLVYRAKKLNDHFYLDILEKGISLWETGPSLQNG